MNFAREVHENIKKHIKATLPKGNEHWVKRILTWLFLGTIASIVGVLLIFTLAIAVMSIGLPDVRDFIKLAGTESTIIFDRNGGTLYTIHGEENRKYVALTEIAPYLQKATIAIEDDEFYSHGGFDIPGITMAVLHEVFGIGAARGGSTITQQLAKNAFLSRERSYTRKLKELILAVRLERSYDKDKILELYLNRIPYGSNAYGVELASKMYFGKDANRLTLAESAILAGLPQAPSYYSPFGPNAFSKLEREFGTAELRKKIPETVQDINENDFLTGLVGRKVEIVPGHEIYLPGRADIVLARMLELEFITKPEHDAAIKDLQNITFTKFTEKFRAAHFVFYIRTLIEDMFGKDLIAQGGLQVYTTLDPDLQTAAEQFVSEQITASKEAHSVSNAALFSMNAKTGEVLAMVGSADYFDEAAHGNVNHVFAKRQPGSSFKPIAYAKAFLNRYSPATIIYDTPTNFGAGYRPDNYDGKFLGPISIRYALGHSRNIPALKAYFLADREVEIIDLARKLGIESLDANGNFGPPLAIGAGEVKLAEMVQAFSVFATGGVKRDYYSILKVVDRDETTIYNKQNEENRYQDVLDPQVAYLINNVLSDQTVNLGPRLNVPGHTTAVKTGTSNKEITPVKILPSNLWTVGYTPEIVTGVWAGNSDGSPTKPTADGYNIAAPIWQKFMSKALEGKPNEAFPRPAGITSVTVSKATGKLVSADTPVNDKVTEIFASYSVPTEVDDIYKLIEVNKDDNLLPNEFTPPEKIEKKLFMNHHDPIGTYSSWLAGIKDWVAKKRVEDPAYPNFPPTEITKEFSAQTAESKPTIQITSPAAFTVTSEMEIEVNVAISAPNGVTKVLFYIDDRNTPSSVARKSPYKGKIKFSASTAAGEHTITAKVFDKLGYTEEAKVQIKLEK